MRNYSEIGCLTLLGVTLTVYVAVGTYQSHEDWSRRPEKKISAEEMFKAIKEGSGKHYFVKVSTPSVLPGECNKSFDGFSTISISALSEISVLPEILPDPVLFTLPERFGSGLFLTGFTDKNYLSPEQDYLNAGFYLSREIRAGPRLA